MKISKLKKSFKFSNPITSIKKYFAKKLQEKMERKVAEKKVNDHLQWLIDEYRLIQKKESKLSSTQRRNVEAQIEKYIESGHIVPE